MGRLAEWLRQVEGDYNEIRSRSAEIHSELTSLDPSDYAIHPEPTSGRLTTGVKPQLDLVKRRQPQKKAEEDPLAFIPKFKPKPWDIEVEDAGKNFFMPTGWDIEVDE